jgi:hypothetical protein
MEENPGKFVFNPEFMARNPQIVAIMEAFQEYKAPARQTTTAKHESGVSEISKTTKTATARKAVKHHHGGSGDDGDDGSSLSSFTNTDSDDDKKPVRVPNKKRAPITIESLGKDYTGMVLKSDLDLEDDGSIVTISTSRDETTELEVLYQRIDESIRAAALKCRTPTMLQKLGIFRVKI